jgi:hypothetical protein
VQSGTRGFRAAALVAAGGVALHQLRYLLGYGSSSEHALASHGHGYLHVTTLLVGVVLALAVGQLVAALARPGAAPAGERRAPLGRLWLGATLALLTVYTSQELAEGLLSAGHPTGLAALAAGGGAWALPLAGALGLVVALLIRGADAAIAAASRRAVVYTSLAAPAGRASVKPTAVHLVADCVLARNLAGRAPPLGSA